MSKICPTPFPCCALGIVPTALGTYSIRAFPSSPLYIPGFTVLNGNGGVALFTFSVDSAGAEALNALDLAINSSGQFVGPGDVIGTASFTLSVVDASGECTGQADYTITMVA